jgi:hypothetical protein
LQLCVCACRIDRLARRDSSKTALKLESAEDSGMSAAADVIASAFARGFLAGHRFAFMAE